MSPTAYSPRWTPPEKEDTHLCDMPGCNEPGKHRAPKSRYSPIKKDYYRFCQNHAAEYNKQWNYFDGMSEMEIEMYWEDLDTEHRPTYKRDGSFTAENLYKAFTRKFGDVFGSGASMEEMAGQIPPPNRRVEKALRVMEMRWPVSKDQVKAQFKSLVKQYHPDANPEGGTEDKFKTITEAYTIIMTAVNGG